MKIFIGNRYENLYEESYSTVLNRFFKLLTFNTPIGRNVINNLSTFFLREL